MSLTLSQHLITFQTKYIVHPWINAVNFVKVITCTFIHQDYDVARVLHQSMQYINLCRKSITKYGCDNIMFITCIYFTLYSQQLRNQNVLTYIRLHSTYFYLYELHSTYFYLYQLHSTYMFTYISYIVHIFTYISYIVLILHVRQCKDVIELVTNNTVKFPKYI